MRRRRPRHRVREPSAEHLRPQARGGARSAARAASSADRGRCTFAISVHAFESSTSLRSAALTQLKFPKPRPPGTQPVLAVAVSETSGHAWLVALPPAFRCVK